MAPFSDPHAHEPIEFTPKKRNFWQKLGGGSLSMSLILHGILLAIGAVFVYKIIPPPPEKVVDFMPASGGGGSPASQQKAQQQRVQMMQPNMARVAAVGASSTLVLPEPEEVSQMTSMGSLSSGGLSAGLGGSGAGGGKGDGNGTRFGNGLAPGMGSGTGSTNPFGMTEAASGGLVGTFYDFKQSRAKQKTDIDPDGFRKELQDIVKHGMRESSFSKYFKAPRELYQTKFQIANISADDAPAAFECAKEVEPKCWAVIYRGVVQAPKSGKYRFVGAADDVLFIRFNNRDVFDYGFTIASIARGINGKGPELEDTKNQTDLAKEVRRNTPMPMPITYFKYQTTPGANKNIGGLAAGKEFEVKAGESYPIDILIAEVPGGKFWVSLMIEEIGEKYQKDPSGTPILPLFRLDNSLPGKMKGEAPPFDPNGPVWKLAPGSAKREI